MQRAQTLLKKTDDVLENQSKSLIVHIGTIDLTNDVNVLNNVRKNSHRNEKEITQYRTNVFKVFKQ